MIRPSYRPDIEGLRCIAVVSVVLFHAGYSAFPAGFIGVDIFFVISGFLITSGIYKSIQQGNFSAVDFFNRRFWRIQPLLIVLMIVTVLFEYWRATPADLIKFAASLKDLTLFKSNQYFASLDFGYFADDTSIMPLLHTWSLSIEWQWYFLLPFLLVILAKNFGKRDWQWLLFVGLIATAYLGLRSSDVDDNIRYYSFTLRCFALLAGALVATVDVKTILHRLPPPICEVLSFIFLGLLIYIGTIEKTTPEYPNFFTLWVVLLTSFLIVLGSAEHKTLAWKILSFKPFVFIGMISYSLYIWHWPIFAYARYTQIQVTGWEFAVLIAISVAVATVSYKFIENPLRKLHKKVPLIATLMLLVAVPALMAYHFDRRAVKYQGYPERNPNYAIQNEWQVPHNAKFGICQDPGKITLETYQQCSIGDNKVSHTVLLIGDSWGDHFRELVHVILNDAGLAGVQLSRGNMMPLKDTYQIDKRSNSEVTQIAGMDDKKRIINHIFLDISTQKYEYVIFGNNARYYGANKRNESSFNTVYNDNFKGTLEEIFIYSLKDTIEFIINNGAIPVFIVGVQTHPIGKYEQCGFNVKNCSFEGTIMHNPDELAWRNVLMSAQQQYPQIIIMDLYELICPDNSCSALVDGYPIYSTGSHITAYASHRLGEMYLEKYGNPFINNNSTEASK
ncbi:MAG: acyltransferase [Deferribacteraceae bacterium]|jgi:peptidoglycan/LPS O-acetylase OafA/YrhL|nr:acyltransferase [Deferribacteraceae bacterium]